MSLPNADDLNTLDYPLNGNPYDSVPASDIDLESMDVAFNGNPFVSNPFESILVELIEIEELIDSTDELTACDVVINVETVDIEELIIGLDEELLVGILFPEELIDGLDELAASGEDVPIIQGLDFYLDGNPFCDIPGNGGIFTETMDYPLDGNPFVVDDILNVIFIDIEELVDGLDETLLLPDILIEELVDGLDQLSLNPVVYDELGDVLDEVLVTVNVQIEELIDAIDEVGASDFVPVDLDELGDVLDETFLTINVAIEELIDGLDSVEADDIGIPVDETSCIIIQIGQLQEKIDGTKIVIGEYSEADSLNIAGVNIVIGEFDNVLITNACDIDNPVAATVAVNGIILIEHAATNPGSTALANTSVYCQWLPNGITGSSWNDLFNFGFELDYNGGHFNLFSKKPLKTVGFDPIVTTFLNTYHWQYDQGAYRRLTPVDALANANLGKELEVLGFRGTILDFGPGIADTQAGWTTAGFFGSAQLNLNLNLLTYSSIMGFLIGTNERLSNLGRGGVTDVGGIDVQSAAKTIAMLAGVQLNWYAQDAPLRNTFRLDGLTGVSALSSLAASVGATLRWNGNNKYYVAYPNQSIGLWEVPHPKLLTSAGINYLQHLDLETGARGNRLILFPRAVVTDPSTLTIPTANDQGNGLPTLQQLAKITQRKNSDMPPFIGDLPYNYDKVYIQVLLAQNANLSGLFTTTNPEEWFEFDTATLNVALGNQTSYIFNTYIGNTYVPQYRIDHTLFPPEGTNPDIDDGKFIMSLACSVKSLSDAFDKSKLNAQNNNREALANGLDSVRYIKTYSGTITCQFFGSIPLPGMWGKATIPGGATVFTRLENGDIEESRIPLTGDMVVEGIIENVSVAFPGTITVQVAQYAKIDFGIPKIDIGITGFD